MFQSVFVATVSMKQWNKEIPNGFPVFISCLWGFNEGMVILNQRANYAVAHLLGEGSLDFRNAAEPKHTPTKKQKSLEGTYRNGWLSQLKTSIATYIVRGFPTLVDSLHVSSQGATSRLGISSIDCVLEFMCHVGDVGSWVEKFGKSRSPNLCGLW